MGHHYSDVVGEWGPPTRVLDDGAGGQMIIWEETVSYTTPGHATTKRSDTIISGGGRVLSEPSYDTTYIPPETTTYTKSRTFWVNSEGIIYNWAWKGL